MHAFEYHSSPSLKCRSGESIESQLHKSTNFEHCLNFSSNKTVQQTGKELKHLQGTEVESRPMWKCGRDSIYFNSIFFFIFVDTLYYPKLGPLPRIQNITYIGAVCIWQYTIHYIGAVCIWQYTIHYIGAMCIWQYTIHYIWYKQCCLQVLVNKLRCT